MNLKFQDQSLYLSNSPSWVIHDTTIWMDSSPLLKSFKELDFSIDDTPLKESGLVAMLLDIYDTESIEQLFDMVRFFLDTDKDFNDLSRHYVLSGYNSPPKDFKLTSTHYKFNIEGKSNSMEIEYLSFVEKYIIVWLWYMKHVDIILLWCVNKRMHHNLIKHLLKTFKDTEYSKAKTIFHIWGNEDYGSNVNCKVYKEKGELFHDWITYTNFNKNT